MPRLNLRLGEPRSALVFATVGLLLLLRAASLGGPLIIPDEYGYLALSQAYPYPEAYYDHDPWMVRLNNVGFFALGRLLFMVTPEPEQLLEVLNVAFFLAACYLVGKLMARVADDRSWRRLWFAATLLPFSCYTANFMPESLYMLLFWAVAGVAALVVPSRPLAGAVGLGLLGAALFLVKPHALAILPALAVSSFVGAVLRARRDGKARPWLAGLVAALTIPVAFYSSLVLLYFVLGRRLEWSLFQLVGAVYRSNLRGALAVDSAISWAAMQALAANLVVLGVTLGPSLFAFAWRGATLALQSLRGQELSDREARALTVMAFSAAALAGLLAMVAKFTVDPASPDAASRIHGRYYGFAVPLLLVGHAIGGRRVWERRWRLQAVGLAGLGATAALVLLRQRFRLYPWDDPAAFAFSQIDGRTLIPAIALAACIAYYLTMLAGWRRSMDVYPAFVALVFLLGQLATWGWQKPWSDAIAPSVNAGKALRSLVPPDQLARGLVVGSDRYHNLSLVLHGLRSPTPVLQLPAGATLDETRLPAGTRWVATFDTYDIRIPFLRTVKAPGFVLGRLRSTSASSGEASPGGSRTP